MADPDGNILWLDFIVTIVGISIFVTPGFFIGMALAARQEGLAPDGSGRRPTPAPLWTRGSRRIAAIATDCQPTATPSPSSTPAAPGTTYAPSSYARPGSVGPE